MFKVNHSINSNITSSPTELDCPVISMDEVLIKQPTCNNKDGSITGVKVTSTGSRIQYSWLNANGDIVGTDLDLINVGPGIYTLQVTDNSGCTTPILSSRLKLESVNGITIEGSPVIKPSSCNNEGSITALKVTGATNYFWFCFETGLTYQSNISSDLLNIPPGTYRLTLSNASCSIQAGPYTVPTTVDVPTVIKYQIVQPTCNNITKDSIKIYLSRHPGAAAMGYLVYNSVHTLVDVGPIPAGVITPIINITGKPAGTYYVDISNPDRTCPVQIGTYTLNEPKVTISLDSSLVYNDKCNQHLGAVLPYIQGQTLPGKGSIYSWTSLTTGLVVSRDKIANNLGAGTYRFDFIDVAGCPATADFVITNDSPTIPPPVIDNITLCLPGMANFFVKNRDTSSRYKLYASLTDAVPLAESNGGGFSRRVTETTDFYVSCAHADCESERVKITITVVANISIPNLFTPNNDGVNDFWNIGGIENFPGTEIKIFNRNGRQVFYSMDNAVVFNGLFNGKKLPAGVYYYTIDVKQPICFGKIAGSLTLIR